jgi:chaperonin cofactor prefoldin
MSSPEYEQLVRFLGPRFDTIDRRFETIDRRFDSVDRKFDELRAELLQRLRSSS